MGTNEESLNHSFSSAVRTIPPKTRGNRGYFPSSKVKNRVVNYESQIERDFFLLLDHADDVLRFQPQPITIFYTTIDGTKKKYTPDVFVEFSNGIRLLVEIKDEDTFQQEKSKFKERWDACGLWADKKQMTFIVLTDIDIRNARLSNIWFTIGSAKVFQNNKYAKKLISFLKNDPDPITFNSLCIRFAEDLGVTINKSSQIICYAIYHGIVFVDTFSTRPLSANMKIRIRYNNNKSPFKPLWVELDEILENRDENRVFKIKEQSLKEFKSDRIFNVDNKVSTKETIVKDFLKTPSHKRDVAWRKRFEEEHKIGKSTIYRWIKKYETGGVEGLINHYTHKRKKWDTEALQYFEKARLYWLKPNISYTKAYGDESLSKTNHSLKKIWKHKKLPLPSLSTFKRYIQNNTLYSEKIEAKEGKKRRRSLKPSLKSFQGAIMPMQVLQFDNTSFDVFLTDERFKQSIGTSNLCAAIDCYTRMITGFELTLNSINRQCILETLVQSITNKERFLDQIFSQNELVTSWDIEGFPVLILIDNGMDYRADDVKRFCIEYDIILEFAPIKTPRFKAYIENWFSLLKNGLLEELAEEGFRPNLTKRIINPDLDPEKGAIFNFQRMEKWLTSWILDEYHLENPYNDGVPAPYLRYEDFEKGEGNIILPLPREPPVKQSNKDKLIRYSLMSSVRKFKSEIEWENLKFSSDGMREVWRKVGTKKEIELRFDFRDIRTLWLKSPINGKPIKLGLTTGWANAIAEFHQDKPISLSAWRKEIKEIKNRNKLRITPHSYQKEMGRMYREQLKENAKQDRTKSQVRRQESEKENKAKIKRKSLNKSKSKLKGENQDIEKPKKKWKEREVDWSKVKLLPTDDMYKG